MVFDRSPRPAVVQTVERALFVAVAIVLALAFVYRWWETPYWSFNGTRLLPAYLFAAGKTWFFPAGQGAQLSSVYAPVTAAVFSPAALTRDPDAAVRIASAVTALLTCGAAALVVGRLVRSDLASRILTLLLGLGLVLFCPPLRYSMINPHADGPALAFTAAAIWAALAPSSLGWLWAAGLFSALAAWSKQPFLAAPIAIAAYLLLSGRRRDAVHYGGAAATGTLSLLLLCGFAYGFEELYFNLVVVQGRVSTALSRTESLRAAIQAFRSLVTDGFYLIVPALAYAGYSVLEGDRDGSASRQHRIASRRWLLPLLMALLLTPVSVMGLAKPLGGINSLSFSLYFYLLATLGALQEALSRDAGRARDAGAASLVRATAWASLVVVSLWNLPLAGQQLLRPSTRDSETTVALEALRGRPDVYFPFFPLAHYLAGGELCHTATAFYDLELGGLPMDRQHVLAHIPKPTRYIAFGEDPNAPDILLAKLAASGEQLEDPYVMRYFPEFTERVDLPQLPGWKVYARPGNAAAALR